MKLKKGDKIAIVSPASAVNPDYIDGACRTLEAWGFVPVPGEHCRNRHNYYSGSLEERLADFRSALHNPEIKAILCARGGYGAIHLAEHITPEEITAHAKWIIGFSDISVFHALWRKANIPSVHASMAKHLALFRENDFCNTALRNILEGNHTSYKFHPHHLNRTGSTTGEIVGGNIAVLGGLLTTPLDIFKPGKILFIEDIGEPIYKVERMLYTLRLSGVLGSLKGLVVGRFTDYLEPDNNGETMYGMIHRMIARYSYPVAFNIPIGHIDDNHPITEGANATLCVDTDGVSLSF